MNPPTVRTRFAPSPTGFLHLGALRTAAYAYALAKHSGGQFILRLEDTDQKREVEGAEEKLKEILKRFNLNWDEYYVQSKRVKTGIYQKAAQQLLDAGHAFYCFCQLKTKAEITADRQKKIEFRDPCRSLTAAEIDAKLKSGVKPAIRLKVPDGETVSYTDFILAKETSWKTDVVDDAMLLKSDGFPTYHLAVVVDDHEMHITHALRGHDWLPSTPIHLLVYRFLDYDLPQIGHLTDILDPAGGKLSKRKGNVSVEQFLDDGYLPQALLNFVILLGWAPKDNRELFTLEEFVAHFDERGFQKANPQLNLQKLLWFNGQYLRRLSDETLLQLIKPQLQHPAADDLLKQIIPLVKPRLNTLKEINTLAGFFFVRPQNPSLESSDKDYLAVARQVLAESPFTKVDLETALVEKVRQNGWQNGPFFMALRLAVCGQRVTPPLTESIIILGRDEVLTRLDQALPS